MGRCSVRARTTDSRATSAASANPPVWTSVALSRACASHTSGRSFKASAAAITARASPLCADDRVVEVSARAVNEPALEQHAAQQHLGADEAPPVPRIAAALGLARMVSHWLSFDEGGRIGSIDLGGRAAQRQGFLHDTHGCIDVAKGVARIGQPDADVVRRLTCQSRSASIVAPFEKDACLAEIAAEIVQCA